MVPDLAEQLAVVTTLTEPVRRRLYLYVAAQHRPVSRAEVAAAQGVGRTVAAFHLDKLVEAGLYSRAERHHELTIPARSYALASRLLADAVDQAGADPLLQAAARREGERQASPSGSPSRRSGTSSMPASTLP